MIFRRLLKKWSSNPSDYGEVSAQWTKDGKIYGPYTLQYIVLSDWSSWPKYGRFHQDRNWRDFQEILDIIERLHPTKERIEFLSEQAPELDLKSVGFKKATQLTEQFERAKNEKEQIRKAEEQGRLPITAYTKRRLKEAGIPEPKGMTRGEATELLARKARRKVRTIN